MGARNHRELICWQLADKLRRLVFQHTSSGPVSRDFGFRDQIRRASSSGCSNIAEGFYLRHDKQFARYLNIARGSQGETLDRLGEGLSCGYFSREAHAEMDNLCHRAMIATLRLIQSLARNPRDNRRKTP
jgi:four helix bundle protein